MTDISIKPSENKVSRILVIITLMISLVVGFIGFIFISGPCDYDACRQGTSVVGGIVTITAFLAFFLLINVVRPLVSTRAFLVLIGIYVAFVLFASIEAKALVSGVSFFGQVERIIKGPSVEIAAHKDNAYYIDAIKKEDSSLCDSISLPSTALFCKRTIAVKLLDSKKCATDDVDCPGIISDITISNMAVKNNDINMCSLLVDKDKCYEEVAFSTRDVANCKIFQTTDPRRFSCVVGIGILKNDPTVCKDTPPPYDSKTCEKLVVEKDSLYRPQLRFEGIK